MKRLMITLSAAALAFGLYAEDTGAVIAGEDFNGLTELPATVTSAGESAISTTPFTFSKETSAGTPDQFRLADPLENMAIKTKLDAPAYYSLSAAQSMSGVYFDSLVKFTACDEDAVVPTGSNAKIMVWVKEDETAGTTNLMVTAGYFNDAVGGIEAKNYVCGAPSKYGITGDGDWCRLTIKAVNDITAGGNIPGFVIFVNATALQIASDKAIGVDGSAKDSLNKVCKIWADGDKLFPSLVAGQTISAVGFAGQGAVDDISFTTIEPKDAQGAEFALDPVPDIATVTINGVAVPCADEAALNTALAGLAAGNTAVISLTEGNLTFATENGLVIPDVAANVTLDLKGQTITGADGEYAITVGEASTLTITNSVAGGKVVGTVYNDGGTLNVQDGTFDGMIWQAGSCYITGGAFRAEDNTDLAGNATFDPNMGLVQQGDYLVVGQTSLPKHFFIQIVDGVATSNEYEEGDAITAPTEPTPAKAWESFVGWQPAVPATMGTEDVTVTAQFKFLDQDSDDNYLVASVDDFVKLQAYVADGQTTDGKVFKQTADIDLTGKAWAGIGTYVSENSADNRMFCGVYDGNEKTIANVTFAKKDYNGLFGNLGGEAQIKDLTITVAGIASEGTATSYGFGSAAGYAMGTDVLLENITVNPAVDGQASIQGTHNMAGIGARLAGKITLKDCVNNLDISTTYSKIGGMCAIASQRDAAGAIEFNGCVNNGTITAVGLTKANTEAGSDGCSGILGYIQDGSTTDPKAGNKPVSFINCANNGTLQHTGDTGSTKSCIASILGKAGGQSYVTVDGNTATAAKLSVASGTAPDGLIFATVDGNVATFVANSELAAGDTYKVMAAGGAPVIELAEGETIAFDQTLAGIDATGITAETGCKIEATGEGQPIVYTAVKDGGWNPDADPSVKASDVISSGLPTALNDVSFKTLSTWATANSVDFSAPEDIIVDAFLFNCANTDTAVEAEAAAFKFTAISYDAEKGWVTPTVVENTDGKAFNGTIVVKSYSDVTCTTEADDGNFFKAFLVPVSVAE